MEQYILDFIKSERIRFNIYDNNQFGNSFSTVARYYKFLKIIIFEYQKLVSEYSKAFFDLQKTINKNPGPHSLTNKQIELYSTMNDLGTKVQLKIETYYQFAKIILDKIAFALELYFGPRISKSISHHKMVENYENSGQLKIEKYCQDKELKIDKKLLDKMVSLQKDISDFRDDYITHYNCPRIWRGTDIEGKMVLGKMCPKNEDEKIMKISKNLDELKKEIDQYIEGIIDFIDKNNDKTNLSIKQI